MSHHHWHDHWHGGKPEPGSRVSSLAWCQPLRSVDRKVAGRNASERMVSPEIERDRSGRPDPSTGKAASRYRDMASGPGRFRGSYRWHVTEGRDGNKGDPSGSGASPDKPPRQGRFDGRAEVRLTDSTRRTGEPSTGGSGQRQVIRSGATWAPCNGSDSPLCKERMKLTMDMDLGRIAAKVL